MMKREKSYALSFVRLMAMLFVICCHMFEWIGYDLGYADNLGSVGQFLSVGVQLFLILSGYLYGRREKLFQNTTRPRFVLNGFKKILLDYYVYNAMVIIPVYFYLRPEEITYRKIFDILTCSTCISGVHHMWFIPYILVCYLLTPLLYDVKQEVLAKCKKLYEYVGAVFIILLLLEVVDVAFDIYFICTWIGCYVVGFFLPDMLGKCTSKQKRVGFTILTLLSLCVGVPKVYLQYWRSYLVGSNNLPITLFYNGVQCIYALVLFIMFFVAGKRLCRQNIVRKILDFSDIYSYDIYLGHMIFVKGVLSLLETTGNIWIDVVITSGAIIASGMLLRYICRLSEKIFGEYMVFDFLRFLLVGGSSTLIDYYIYLTLNNNYVHVIVAKAISMCIACTYSFFLNKMFTFRDEKKVHASQVAKYVMSQGVNIAVNVTVNTVLFYVTGRRLVAFVLATGIAMIVNFLLQKFIVFKKSGEA